MAHTTVESQFNDPMTERDALQTNEKNDADTLANLKRQMAGLDPIVAALGNLINSHIQLFREISSLRYEALLTGFELDVTPILLVHTAPNQRQRSVEHINTVTTYYVQFA
jgi:hypothetical protein